MTTIPSYVAKGTYAAGIGAVSPGIPAGMQAGDLMILVIETQATINPSAPTGWSLIPVGSSNANNPTGTVNDWRVVICYRFWQSGDAAPSIADTGDHTSAVIFGIRGAHAITPFGSDAAPGDRTGGDGTSTQMQFSQLVTQAGETNVLCMFVGVWAADNAGPIISSLANTSPYTNVTTRHDGGTVDGEGGGIFVVTADRAAASMNANPSLTVNQSFATSAGGMGFYILPSPDAVDHTITANLGSVTGTVSVSLLINHTITALLSAVTASAEVDLLNIEVDITAQLAAVTASAEIELSQQIDITATLEAVTSSAQVDSLIEATIVAELGAITASSEIIFVTDISIDVVADLGAITSSAWVFVGRLAPPTDPDYTIVLPEVERSLSVAGLDRTITVPGLDRTITVPGLNRTLEVI